MTTINKIARAGVIGTLLMGAVALKASNPITNTNKTPNQTEIVSREGAEALRAATLCVNEVQQSAVPTVQNPRIVSTFKKFAGNAEELKQVDTVVNDLFKDCGTFWASAQLQHELDRQQLYLLLNQDTEKLTKLNPKLAEKVKELEPAFYNGVKNNDASHVEKWLENKYSPSLIGMLSFDHKPTAKEVSDKIDEIATKKANFTIDDIIDYHVYTDDFNRKVINKKTDNLSLAELIAYKIFVLDKIMIKKTLTNSNFFGKNSYITKYSNLEAYYDKWMDTVSPRNNQ